jgi:hypothetical protein
MRLLMARLCRCTLLSVTALVWCVPLSASDGQGTGVDDALKLFPGYHVLTSQERDPSLKAYIAQHFPKANPSVVHADFDGDGEQDYALLLKNDKLGKTILVVVLCPAESPCKSVYNLDVSTDSSSVYIRPVPVGSRVSQTEAIPTSDHSTGRFKSAGIRLRYYEQAEVVLYWNSKLKKIEEVQTGD